MSFEKNEWLLPPFRIRTVEPIYFLTKEERIKRIQKVQFNLFCLMSSDIIIDLLTDSGTGAMSKNQRAAMMRSDEAYAGSESFERLKRAVQDIMGFQYVLPTHQGRGAEQVLDAVLVKEGQIVPGNTHFDTTKAHIEARKGKAVDCTISQAFNSKEYYPFKGNLDIGRLEKILRNQQDDIAYILITVTCNSIGGQPVSLQNIKDVSRLARKYGVLLFFDAARYAENAYFIKKREKGYQEKSIAEIVKEMMSYADGALMSAKKDAIVPIGGFIALRDEKLYHDLVPINVLMEGFPTYGGMSGEAMEAIAVGLYEGIGERYLAYRIEGQVKYLGDELRKRGIPIVYPIGGHAVYIDAKKFLPHIPQFEFPAQALCCEIYIEGGIRAVEIGALLAGRDPETDDNIYPELELVRLTIPRRVYLREHLDYVVEIIEKIWRHRESIQGLKFDYEAPILRHFTSTFERIEKPD